MLASLVALSPVVVLAEPVKLQLEADSSDTSPLKIAVAANFAKTAQLLVESYQTVSETKILLMIASTGKHATQIQYGMNVDLYLAADQRRPKLLEQKGFAIAGSRFDYARGRLALWSADLSLSGDQGQVLKHGDFNYIAIANPKLAPYGEAALQLLENKGVAKEASAKVVRGDSVAQAFQFVASGSADIGLLAYSQVVELARGSHWLVPRDMHEPIMQSGVIIKDSLEIRDFVGFLRSEKALSLIEQGGYERP